MSKTHFTDVDTVAERRAVQEAKRSFTSSPDLTPDETILWQGRPKRGIAFEFMDVILVPFSIVWSMFALSAILFPSPNLPPNRQAGLLHISMSGIAAVYITVGRFIVDALYRSKLRYRVTTKRVMILDGVRGRVRAFDRRVLRLELIEYANGRGTIRLIGANDRSLWTMQSQYLHACLGQRPQLYRIRDARHVYELLRPEPPKPN